MGLPNRKLEQGIIATLTVSFVMWSAAFIYRSSFIAVDGNRYFCLFDDAMISMRYAWNFSHGLGLVWNPGEHVEGYTNTLMTLLMSLATLIFDKSAAALFIQILGAGFMLAIAFVSMRIASHIVPGESYQHQALLRVLTFFCVLSYYPLVYWSLMGMETGLLTLLLLLGVLFGFDYTTCKKPIFLLFSVGCLGMAYLTRNDSIIFTLLILSYVIWELKPTTNGKSLVWVLATIGLYFLFVIGLMAFRYSYYGELLPNTYTLKLTGMPLLERLRYGAGFVRPFLTGTAFILVLASMDLIFDFCKRKLLLLFIAISAIGYQVYVGGDPWFYWRIMSPTMPLVFILFISAANAIVLAMSRTQAFSDYFSRNPIFPRKYINEALVVSVTLVGLLSADSFFLPEISLLQKPYTAEDNQKNVNTAVVLEQLTTSDASVGVFWGGSIPYYTGRRAIDFLGKSDKHIARLPLDVSGKVDQHGKRGVPGHNKYDLNYSIKTLEPTYVQRLYWGEQDLSQWAQTRYVKVEYKGVSLFLLRDSPAVLWGKINAH